VKPVQVSTLSLYTSSPPTSLPPLLLPPSTISPPLYEMSQHDLYAIIWQQQEQLVAIQAQLQALAERELEATGTASIEVAKPQVFDETSSKISGFVMVCKLYIRMKMREMVVEEQIQ